MVAGSVSAQTELVTDGGFEAGPGSGNWVEASTNFGTPLCDLALCGNGTGTGPATGTYWAWFGGYAGGTETGSLEQSFVIPSGGTAELTFKLEQIVCDDPLDILEVTIDGNVVFTSDGGSPLCTVLGYSMQTVDISTYADGLSHTLAFVSTTFSTNGGVTNFFVDDVSVIHSTGGGGGCEIPAAFPGLNVPIPDGDPLGVTDAQTVSGIPGTALGTDVQLKRVCFAIDHTWVGDLYVKLIAPNGTEVVLLDQPGVPATTFGCDGDNLDVCIEKGVGNELENECNNLPAISGTWTAANGADLAAINAAGGSPNGSWQLFVSDAVLADPGTLIEWELVFDNGPIASWLAPDTICNTSGTISLDPLVTGTTGGVWSGTGVTGSTFDPAGLSGGISITYTVTDIVSGCSDAQTSIIQVVNGVPVASFTFSTVSLTANFTSTSTGAASYLWDFGDSNTSTDQNPVHTYAAAGTYTVTLTVFNICGSNTTTQTVTIAGCPDIMVDGGFEAGPGSGSWIEASTNFGTPLCDLAGCGNGTGTGPRTGTFWAWFGGIATFEEGSVSQSITIPVGTATLSFWLEQIVCDSPDDFLKVAIDADTVFTTDGTSPLCGVLGYSQQSVNIDAYADGNSHTINFFSRVYGTNGGNTNFFVDDITLEACPPIGFAETQLDQHISILPNPVRDVFEIRFTDITTSNVEIEITDVIGKSIASKMISKVYDNQSEKVNVSSWSKGVYFVKVSDGSSSVIRKIVVQ